MSWISSDWQNRAPITFDNISGSATIDGTCTVPQQWPEFWESVRSDGHDIRITDADGVTALTWQRGVWNYAGKNLRIDIDNWSPASSNAIVVAWIYWNHTGTPSDDSGSFSTVSPKTGTILNNVPPPGSVIVPAKPLPTDSAVPQPRYAWPPNQEGGVYFNLAGVLASHGAPYEGHSQQEEVSAIVVNTNNAGSPYAAGNTPALTRMIEHKGITLIRMWLIAGADGSDYTDQITVTTTDGRSLIYAAVRVANTPQE